MAEHPTLSAIELLRSKSLPMLVQDEIVRMLHAGEIVSGAKLNEVALAGRLGVSRGPVREAFRALEEAGLVKLEKNRGVFVRDISDREASELYDVRAGFDDLAGRLLAPVISDAQLAELNAIVDAMDRLETEGIDAYFPMNIRFHDRIVEMTGNRKLITLYRRLINEMHLLRRHGLVHGGGLPVSNGEHRAIVAALAVRDPDTAARTMRNHVVSGRARMVAARVSSAPDAA
jgi:phosphonate utilization transcriptional regulator